jgi:hypothetical protein
MSIVRACTALTAILVSTTAFGALQLPANVNAEAAGPGGTVVHYSASGGAGGDDQNGRPSGAPAQCAPASGSTFPIGTTTVNCTDGVDSGSFEVTVGDHTPPSLQLPGAINVQATSNDGAVVSWTATATDVVDGSVAVSCAPASGTLFPIGTTTVICTATDSRNNSAGGGFVVNVSKKSEPPPQQATNLEAEATGPDGAIVSFPSGQTGADDANGRPTATCMPASGSKFPLGKTNVQCDSGVTFEVEVVDTTGPKLALPRDLTTYTTSDSGASVTFAATASDLVDGDVAITCSPSSGSLFAIGTTEVSCESSDTRSNKSNGKFHVTVVKAGPSPDDRTVEATGPNGAVVTYSQTGSGPEDENGRPGSSCAPASGSTFPLGATLVQCTGGVAFTITVVDTTAPAILVPADVTTNDSVVHYTASAHDLVDGSVLVTCNPASGSTFASGTTVVTCSASDSRNNGASATFSVTVQDGTPPDDTEAPVIHSISASPAVLLPPNGKLVDVVLDVHATDNLDPAPVVRIYDISANEALDPSDVAIVADLAAKVRATRNPQGTGRVYTLFVEAIDASGNRSVGSVQVIVPHDASGSGTTAPAPKKRAVRK